MSPVGIEKLIRRPHIINNLLFLEELVLFCQKQANKIKVVYFYIFLKYCFNFYFIIQRSSFNILLTNSGRRDNKMDCTQNAQFPKNFYCLKQFYLF
ncbi:hypothetical protein [uncultured Gilliamella sp.]|uniref:hypothetical protein n=1 Tax=uncultured Gilliamella sp. TaxID=1193505 RepID=UPI0025DAB758|nr:hypothetical protein [uncultured Gilliamella sp.]